jgi:hypothetical protein
MFARWCGKRAQRACRAVGSNRRTAAMDAGRLTRLENAVAKLTVNVQTMSNRLDSLDLQMAEGRVQSMSGVSKVIRRRGKRHGERATSTIGVGPAPPPAPCTDRTGYVSLMTSHVQRIGPSTFMARNGSFGSSVAKRHEKQVQLLVALVRSLRRVELCRRDFIVLLGTQVPMSLAQQRMLTREGILIHPAPPLIPGVPTADKLLVWKLTNYSQLAVIDADLMFVRPIDALFGGGTELTAAHHPYDHLQAQCDVPIAARGIAALLVVRPNLGTYSALMSYLLRRFRKEQLLYSDQTGVMCYFGGRSRTLPCPYVFDVAMTSGEWLPKWERNCHKHARAHVLRNCLPDVTDRCESHAHLGICNETSAHVRRECTWSSVSPEVHAIHFKGTKKPWVSATHTSCRSLRFGPMGVRPHQGNSEQEHVDATDRVEWNPTWKLPGASSVGACISQQRRLPVYWARRVDGPILSRKCCNSHTVMAAQWNSLLDGTEI